jgi:hypothetical protein
VVKTWKGKQFVMKRVRLDDTVDPMIERPRIVGGETVRVSEHPKMCANDRVNLTLVTQDGLRLFLTTRELEANIA